MLSEWLFESPPEFVYGELWYFTVLKPVYCLQFTRTLETVLHECESVGGFLQLGTDQRALV